MAHLTADREPSFAIERLLFRRELLGGGTAARGALPTRQFVVARLRVKMAMAVEGVNACSVALVAEMLEIVAIGCVARRDETLALGECLGLIEELSLLGRTDGNLPLPSAFGSRILEQQALAAIRPRWNDLDRFLSPQAEERLQAE